MLRLEENNFNDKVSKPITLIIEIINNKDCAAENVPTKEVP